MRAELNIGVLRKYKSYVLGVQNLCTGNTNPLYQEYKSFVLRLIAVLFLMEIGISGVWAQSVTVTIDNGITNGTVSQSSIAGREVTLTVTPASGYYIKSSDIVVEKLVGADQANVARRRVPDLANRIEGKLYITVENPETHENENKEVYTVSASQTGKYIFTVPAGYDNVYVTATFTAIVANEITNSTTSVTWSANGTYILVDDIDASVLDNLYYSDVTNKIVRTDAFTGTLEGRAKADGTFPVIRNLKHPLFATATGAKIHNIMLKDVGISQADYVGAIACTANGDTRIYNCGILPGTITRDAKGNVTSYGSSVASTDSYCGSLVGFLDGSARVVNCFSYANIDGGSVKAGIVGYNNVATVYTNIQTMVMNCMFYGDITEGNTISPIYGGTSISNDYKASTNNRLNNYNYYLYEAPFSKNNTTSHVIISTYNCALAAEERFLVRFEFYRHLLNSTRELAAWYATGVANNGKGIGSANKMAKWVLDKNIAPYPILKEQRTYPSVVNYDPTYTYIDGEKQQRDTITVRNHGGQLGTLTVHISHPTTPTAGQAWPSNATLNQTTLSIPILDKDTANYNFNYRKIQLPYYNDVGDKNYTSYKVVTGWMITSMSGGTRGSYTETNYDYPNYNYADRSTYAKDLYSVSKRIFSQGGYFNVPDGVTAITIEPYWGKAVYLSDLCYDRYGYNNTDNLSQVGGGARYTATSDGKYYIDIYEDDNLQQVYTTASGAIGALSGVTNSTVYDYAVVLVGNYHHHTTEGKNGDEISSGATPFTIMSIDLNKDNEPDYCLIYRSGKNRQMTPIRFDFITVPGMVMAHKMATHGDLGIPGNCCPKGWFEITTTGLIKYGQFEHSQPPSNKTLSPLILMGGIIEQFVANNTSTNADAVTQTKYMLLGDNVWFKLFNNGCHMDKWLDPPCRPISITGGEYEAFYLSGYFRPDAKPANENAECYIDGGKFGEVAGAGQEHIYGDVKWLINHADIKSFYGGGINAAKPVTGNIETNIDNSWVDYFYGGPMFGDMLKTGTYTITHAKDKDGTNTGTITVNVASDRTVTTTATNTVFGTYFGAGYGGTAIYREQFYNRFESLNYSEWNTKVNGTYKSGTRGYYASGKGVKVNYNYEFFGGSAGNVHRLYLHYASFSLAKTNNVTSELTGCTVLHNFYGGGSLGAVDGNATSTLTNCTVKGNVFGAGFSVTIPKVDIRDLRTNPFIPEPFYNTNTGVYEKGGYPDNTSYSWIHVEDLGNSSALDEDTHSIKTTENLNDLGKVLGNVNLTIKGNTTVGTMITTGDEETGDEETTLSGGNVYGGGDESAVSGNTIVTIEGNTEVLGNVFGGGNKGKVTGTATVNIGEEE